MFPKTLLSVQIMFQQFFSIFRIFLRSRFLFLDEIFYIKHSFNFSQFLIAALFSL